MQERCSQHKANFTLLHSPMRPSTWSNVEKLTSGWCLRINAVLFFKKISWHFLQISHSCHFSFSLGVQCILKPICLIKAPQGRLIVIVWQPLEHISDPSCKTVMTSSTSCRYLSMFEKTAENVGSGSNFSGPTNWWACCLTCGAI